MKLPKVLVFASGAKDGGGSGFENLVKTGKRKGLWYEIAAVVSNHENGGVREKADRLKVPFIHFPGPWTAEMYQWLWEKTGARYTALSGWLKPVRGLDPRTTFNIHPGPLPQFGGPGMYGHHVHEAVMTAFRQGQITHSEVCMHFVTEDYDDGPICFRCKVPIKEDDTAETLARRVNAAEHRFQPLITGLIAAGQIHWDGQNLASLVVPPECLSCRFLS